MTVSWCRPIHVRRRYFLSRINVPSEQSRLCLQLEFQKALKMDLSTNVFVFLIRVKDCYVIVPCRITRSKIMRTCIYTFHIYFCPKHNLHQNSSPSFSIPLLKKCWWVQKKIISVLLAVNISNGNIYMTLDQIKWWWYST